MRLEGKVAIITGSSSGLGRATAVLFAKEGAKVVVNANKNISGGEETVQLIREAGGEAVFVQASVAKSADCKHLQSTMKCRSWSHWAKPAQICRRLSSTSSAAIHR